MSLVVILGGCSRRTWWSFLLDWSPIYTTFTVAVLLVHDHMLSQMATYWFVIAWFDNQSVQKSKVRQAAKDVVKSEVYSQTYSS